MDVYARGVNVNLTPLTSNRGALATDARGCSLWRYLLERPPRAWESWVRDPLGTRYVVWTVRTREGVLHWCRDQDGSEVQGGECNMCMPVVSM